MSQEPGRFQVGVVSEGVQGRGEFEVGEGGAQRWAPGYDGAPGVDGGEITEEGFGVAAAQVDEFGIEFGAAAGAQQGHDGGDAAGAPGGFAVVGDLHDSHDGFDFGSGQPGGHALAVPAFEGLGQCPPHLVGQAEPVGDVTGRLAVRHKGIHDLAEAADEEPAEQGDTPQPAVGGEVPQQESHGGHGGQVDLVAVGAQLPVVAEPAGHFVGVGHAADPGQQRYVEGRALVGFGESGCPGEPGGDHRLPQHVLLGLAQTQVGGQ